MATTSENMPAVTHTGNRLPWYLQDLPRYLKTFGALTVMYIGLRLYQGAFAVSAGLDSTEPAFERYWMRLFYIELAVIAVVMTGLWAYLWFTRDRQLDKLSPKEEIRRYFTLTMWISIYTFRCIGPAVILPNRTIPGIRSRFEIRRSRPTTSSSFTLIFRCT